MAWATCGRASSMVGCFLSPASSAGAGDVVEEVGLVEGGVLQSPILGGVLAGLESELADPEVEDPLFPLFSEDCTLPIVFWFKDLKDS